MEAVLINVIRYSKRHLRCGLLLMLVLSFMLVGCSGDEWTVTMTPVDTNVRGFSLSPDGTLIAASHSYGTYYEDIEVLIFGVEQPLEESFSSPIFTIDYPGVELTWSPDGQYLAIGGPTGDIAIWDMDSERIIQEYRVIPDGLDLSSANPKQILWPKPGDRLLPIYLLNLPLVDPFSGQVVDTLVETGGDPLCNADWTSESGLIAVSSFSSGKGVLWIWDSQSTELLHRFEYDEYILCPLAWSSDGQKLVFRRGDASIMMWDAQSGNAPEELLQLDKRTWRIEWSPDGKLIAFGSLGGVLVLWDVELNEVVFQEDLNYHPDHAISSLTWLPDSRTLITGGETVVIWNITEP